MSLWSCSFEALICSLDDKGIWLTFGGWSMPTGLEYMFVIRHLQSKVRRLQDQC
ncbi:hypothetical protein RAB80_012882 [Fusarium oxysporum f. sp. vasinfectum]|nr:hypothetical protein RAB80_012882 [Fusarium oxysporum f. sp. vasinfectum]KAK2926903.1 hypothetical protein FoTM2_012077 [Fusarium oxysporum f. sp. vasinfectum]